MKLHARAEWDPTEVYEFQVSPIDYHAIKRFKWWVNQGGYISRRSCERSGDYKVSRTVYLHREIMGLEYGDPLVVHHKNADPSDNRRSNLEITTQSDNLRKRNLYNEAAPSQ